MMHMAGITSRPTSHRQLFGSALKWHCCCCYLFSFYVYIVRRRGGGGTGTCGMASSSSSVQGIIKLNMDMDGWMDG